MDEPANTRPCDRCGSTRGVQLWVIRPEGADRGKRRFLCATHAAPLVAAWSLKRGKATIRPS